MKNKKFIEKALVFVVAFITACLACSFVKKSQRTIVNFATGEAFVERKGAAPKALMAGLEIFESDAIKTGSNSFVILAIGDEVMVRVGENSNVLMGTLMNKGTHEITLTQGRVLSWVKKMAKEGSYSVKTPTAIAAVRGTKFMTEYSDGKSIIAVGEGKVKVSRLEKEEVKVIESAKTIVIAGTMEERKITREEQLEIKRLETASVIDKAEKRGGKISESDEKEILEIEKKIDEEIKNARPLSLEEIRARYGRIDVVHLYNGRVIRGAIISRGTILQIITPEGLIRINASQVRQTGSM